MDYGDILGDVTNGGKGSDKFGKWRVAIRDTQLWKRREKGRCEHDHMH
jgi:hypothetical protein